MISMKRTLLYTGVLLLFTANVAAASPVEADPGLIEADSPLYPADVFLDDLLKKPPGEVAHERASEALVAAEANDTAALDRAVTEVDRVAARTNGVEAADGLQQAQQLLQEAKERTPDEADSGLDTALENVEKAKNRFPTDELPGQGGPDSQQP